jgi:hypothetical protein
MFGEWIFVVWLLVVVSGFLLGRQALRNLTPAGQARRRGPWLGSPLWWPADHYTATGNRYRLLTLLCLAAWVVACVVWLLT